ncbi:MAG: helix-turn-helix domain-containing protein [Pseudobdellovibrionaceae bacterium]|jgi:DNA-binding NtrC family response regulator
MNKTLCIIVTDDQQHIDEARQYWQNHDVSFHAFSPTQWRDSLDHTYFRQQLMVGTPSLAAGSPPQPWTVPPGVSPAPQSQNVFAFPGNPENKVQKMEDVEATAIESAIMQYKGNLTEAAKALGIGRATLYRKVKQYQIDPAQARRKRAA